MIVQAMHRPWSTKRSAALDDPRMPLPWGHVEGRWRAGVNETRFALFSDRPERPAPRREALLGEWRQSYAEIRPDGEPVLLALCPSAYERTLWLELYERVGASLPPIAFALSATCARATVLTTASGSRPAPTNCARSRSC